MKQSEFHILEKLAASWGRYSATDGYEYLSYGEGKEAAYEQAADDLMEALSSFRVDDGLDGEA